MDRRIYRPGAGKTPPLMVGRDELMRDWLLQLTAVAYDGRDAAEDLLLTGPRGIGKTCAMSALAERSREQGFEVINLQAAAENRTLVTSLIQQADAAVAAERGPWARAKDALERFAGVELGVGVANLGITLHAPGAGAQTSRTPESLAAALAGLATAARDASPRPTGGVMLTLDEVQVGQSDELALLAATLQRLNVDHPAAPVVFVGTGLPHTMQRLDEAGVTHPDRLLAETPLPLRLDEADARMALVDPALAAGVVWDPRAVDAVLTASNRYPAHLQFYADAVWRHAPGPGVELRDAEAAIPPAAERLIQRSIEPRWEQLSDREAELVTAIAVNGGRATAGQLETTLDRRQGSWSTVRESLIRSGDVYVPRRGELQISVPALANYALGAYPDLQERATRALRPLEAMVHTRNASAHRALEASSHARRPDGPGPAGGGAPRGADARVDRTPGVSRPRRGRHR